MATNPSPFASAVSSDSQGQKPIRVGVIGIGRGRSFMTPACKALGLELVAICDTWEEKLTQMGRQHGVATYTDYDKFLEHDMDAVVLANYFHEHAPFAIKALRAGKHVMSETSACKTLAQGVALCREVEKSGKVYMLAENYPYAKPNLELRRMYQQGEIGQVLFAEGEYNHPIDPDSDYWRRLAPTPEHWRNWLPATYYCTHGLAPLMVITDTMPVAVNALAASTPGPIANSLRRGDTTSSILCRMDNGAIFHIFGLSTPGHSYWWRLHGTEGAMELQRSSTIGMGNLPVRIWHEPHNQKPGQQRECIYQPEWPEYADQANAAGHGGGDFWTSLHFSRAIRGIAPAYLDVYRAVAMSVVGPQAWRSALANGAPFPIPDFKSEQVRKAYENDHWSPFPEDAGPGQPPPSIHGRNDPSPQNLEAYLAKVSEEREA